MTIPAEQTEVAAYLRSLSGVDPIETHISLVFLGAETVWKLKKAVRLSFLDFTRLEDRQRFVNRELALNAPAAPGLYRDVVAVRKLADGSLSLDGPPDAPVLDYVLRMARVPAGDFLDVVADEGRLDAGRLDALADTVAAYHAALPPLPDIRPDVQAVIQGNARAGKEAGLPADAVMAWEADACAMQQRLSAWLAQRASDGFVRRAHGDMHLGNLCLWQGRPVPFDALEFDEDLATIDLGYDLAFLLMDLCMRLDDAAANRVLNRYIARTGDADLLRGLPLFLSMRAMIRAHVDSRVGRKETASRYLEAARTYLPPVAEPGPRPVIVAIGGLPGTGKSTLARALAPQLAPKPGALVLRSDEIRKRQFGAAPEDRLPQEAYTPDASRDVFATLFAHAERTAACGHDVIADATFMDPGHRMALQQAAQRAGADFVGLWLTAPTTELERRIAARTHDASDATVAVLHAALRNDPGAGDWRSLDASDAKAAQGLAIAILDAHLMLRRKRRSELHDKTTLQRS